MAVYDFGDTVYDFGETPATSYSARDVKRYLASPHLNPIARFGGRGDQVAYGKMMQAAKRVHDRIRANSKYPTYTSTYGYQPGLGELQILNEDQVSGGKGLLATALLVGGILLGAKWVLG